MHFILARLVGVVAIGLLIILMSTSLSQAAPRRGFTPEDLVSLDRIGDARISPDRRHVVYDVTSVDYVANRTLHSLWVADLTELPAVPRRLPCSDGGATNARWSPQGERIFFLSTRSGSQQVWETDIGGARANQVTALPTDVVTFRLSPDARWLVVSTAVRVNSDRDESARSTAVLYDRLFIRHWSEWTDGTRNRLYVLSLDEKGVAANPPRALAADFDGDVPGRPFGDDEDVIFSPDGFSVIFAAKLAGRTEVLSTNIDLWQVQLDGKRPPENLTPGNAAMDTSPLFFA